MDFLEPIDRVLPIPEPNVGPDIQPEATQLTLPSIDFDQFTEEEKETLQQMMRIFGRIAADSQYIALVGPLTISSLLIDAPVTGISNRDFAINAADYYNQQIDPARLILFKDKLPPHIYSVLTSAFERAHGIYANGVSGFFTRYKDAHVSCRNIVMQKKKKAIVHLN